MDRRKTSFLAKLPGLLCTLPMAAAALWPLPAQAAMPTLASTSPMDVVNSILSFRLARGAVTIEEFALVERWISPGLMQACSEYRRRLDGPNAVNIGVPSVQTDPVTGAQEALSERFQLDAPQDKGSTQIIIAHLFHPDGTPYGSRRFVLANLPSYGWRITNMGFLRTQCEQGP
ncbi:hypothetical protein [Pinirhizobacter soli]|uniref:hypothetical protein n=1 Tax=Pinirhizobacter soli TaxID=2786953 RepID=UPI00202AA8C5|nr:hypothetical protein [Pinirhizobacter soli]